MRRSGTELRILGGALRGRIIRTFPGLTTRPTKSLVREALFDILGELVAGARVIDLFAGAGALGLEALSRGAGHVVFVENNRKVLALLREQLTALLPADRFTCLGADALRLPAEGLPPGAADLVFVDPPYDLWQDGALVRRLLDQLAHWLARGALAPGVLVVLESDTANVLTHAERTFTLVDRRQYGRTQLFLLGPPHRPT